MRPSLIGKVKVRGVGEMMETVGRCGASVVASNAEKDEFIICVGDEAG